MSATQDDYGVTSENPSPFAGTNGTEPADPSAPNHSARRQLPLVPDGVKADRLPDPLTDGERPLTVGEARERYLKTQRASWNAEDRTSKYERHRYELYPRILEADRQFQGKYNGLTTAMLTRRLSPLDENDDWLTPWECDELLHGGTIRKSVRQALNYHLGDYRFEWVAVTAPTRSAGTPHEHIYLWIEDPDNSISTDELAPALGKHLSNCPNAYEKHHSYRSDGTDGAITVQHSPTIVQKPPERIHGVLEESVGPPVPNTRGSQYVAAQLAHLPLADFYDGQRENPPDPLIAGAALAWTSPHHWFRASSGVPKIEGNTTGG